MRSSIASAINSQAQMHAFFSFCNELYLSLVLVGVYSSHISGNIQFSFFYYKERYCDCLSSGIFPSSIQEKSSAVL